MGAGARARARRAVASRLRGQCAQVPRPGKACEDLGGSAAAPDLARWPVARRNFAEGDARRTSFEVFELHGRGAGRAPGPTPLGPPRRRRHWRSWQTRRTLLVNCDCEDEEPAGSYDLEAELNGIMEVEGAWKAVDPAEA